MKSTRKGLRDGELKKDNYGRIVCADCDETLKKTNNPDEVFSLRTCPECGIEWKELRWDGAYNTVIGPLRGRRGYRNRNVSRFLGENVRILNSW